MLPPRKCKTHDRKQMIIKLLPISDPMPKQLPRRPSRAPSPPELPPAVRALLKGFTVVPYRLLDVSRCIYFGMSVSIPEIPVS